MYRPTRIRLTMGLSLLVASMGLPASTFVVTDDELHPDVYFQVADSIRANLQGDNAPRGLTTARRKQVLRTLDQLARYIEDDPVANASKIRNAQRRINSALLPQVAVNDGKTDVVCRRIKRVGTHQPSTECRSRQQMEQDEFAAEDMIQRMQPGGGFGR